MLSLAAMGIEGIMQFLAICLLAYFYKPPPPVGAGGGYVFGSSVRAAVRASVIHVVVLCFRDISSIC